MKKLFIGLSLAALIIMSMSTLTYAQENDKDFGIGFLAGEPTGLSIKSWMNEDNAIDGGLAWSLGRYDAINIHGDYLWHNYDIFEDIESGILPLYYGIGGRIIFSDDDDDNILGVRVPVGLNYLFDDAPIGLFLEIAPVFNLAPETDFDVDGGVGIRVYL